MEILRHANVSQLLQCRARATELARDSEARR